MGKEYQQQWESCLRSVRMCHPLQTRRRSSKRMAQDVVPRQGLRKRKEERGKILKKIAPEPRNCKVSNWGQWSDCNKSCGIGEMLCTYCEFGLDNDTILSINELCSGEAERRREVVQRPAHGGLQPVLIFFSIVSSFKISFILSIILSGLPCPALVDYKWCGSARNCKTGYFNW